MAAGSTRAGPVVQLSVPDLSGAANHREGLMESFDVGVDLEVMPEERRGIVQCRVECSRTASEGAT